MAHGWVSGPDGRGTLSILQSCCVTVILCSWSTLVLNLPGSSRTLLQKILTKVCWMIFVVLFPEALTAIAAEQYESARQSALDFAAINHPEWTMTHAFFADMGGFHIAAPDFPHFAVDTQQILYLVQKGHLKMPSTSRDDILDKNKADNFARVLAIIQIVWFALQCIDRAVGHLPVTTIELFTLAFVYVTLITYFLWWRKPLDVDTPIVLTLDVPIADILIQAGQAARNPYVLSPLEFVNLPPRMSTITAFDLSLQTVLEVFPKHHSVPIQTFSNGCRPPPRGLSVLEMFMEAFGAMLYASFHLIGWNFSFPTAVEGILWRVTSIILLALLSLYLLFLAWGSLLARPMVMWWCGDGDDRGVRTAYDAVLLLPKWLQRCIFVPAVTLYVAARFYIIIEAFLSLRLVPDAVYATPDVAWFGWIPHI